MEIIPGLPNEISRECLVRVPGTSHYKLTSICKSWESIVTCPQFYEKRKKCSASHELIIILARVRVEAEDDYRIKLYDPLQKTMETLPDIPLRQTNFSHCVFVHHKLFVMGFHEREELLLIYDFRYGRWKRGADLPDRRRRYGCSVDSGKGLIYIAGGHGFALEIRSTAAFYNVEEDKWEYLPPMNWSAVICHSAFVDEKLYVVGGNNTWGAVECYDPDRRIWSRITQFSSLVLCPPLHAFGRLFCACTEGVIEFDYTENRFHLVEAQYPDSLIVDGITMWQSQIVICGRYRFNNHFRVYLFEPGESKWTLLDEFSPSELGDVLKCCGTLTL